MRRINLLQPAVNTAAWMIGGLMILAISVVPACSSGTDDKQEITELDQTEIVQSEDQAAADRAPVSLPPIDEAVPHNYETATFASG